MRKVIAKASQQVLELRWTNGDMFVHGNVYASADQEIKGIVAWGLTSNTAAIYGAVLVKIAVEIAMRSAEQGLNEGFEMRSAVFKNRTDVIREQIALSRNSAPSIRAVRWVGNRKVVRIAAVALKLTPDSDVLAEVESTGTAPAIEREGGNDVVVLRIGVNIGIIDGEFELVIIILSKRRRSKKQRNPKN